ncbi:MAG: GDP-mannose 4,6-dehydratase [Thermoleophilia bacterium]|nr:GDP-mannose 4,6-dehydratase [Thermoleophilia bacterium]
MSSPSVVLVVGATGFIGRHAVDRLSESGFRVLGTSTDGEETDFACDLEVPESVDDALRLARPHAILMTAGRSSVSEAWADPAGAFRINTTGTFNLLEGVRRISPEAHLTLVSSASVYGIPETGDELPFAEVNPSRPASPYGASKAAAEVLAGQYARQNHLRVAVARVFNQIGPGQSEAQAPAEFARDIALAEQRGERKLDLAIGNPEAGRDYTDVRDTARALAGIIKDGETGNFNICSGAGVRMYDVAAGLASHTPVEVGVERTPERAHPADVPLVIGSGKRLQKTIGWQPEIPLWISLLDLLDDWRRRI